MKVFSIILIILGYTFAYSQPQIQIEGNDVYDWGIVDSKDKPLTAKVKIFNKGNDTLKIENVRPGCGCTTAPLDKYNIEPNGYATLDITLKVSSDGKIKKSIRITSNDPVSPTKILSIKANIVPPLSLSVRFLNFGVLTINKESVATVKIKNNTEKSIKINDIIFEPKELSSNIKKTTEIPSNKELTLEVKYTPTKSTEFSGKVTLKTDYKNMKTIELSVVGRFPKTEKK